MKLWEALNLDLYQPELVCLVGGGGKTSAMFGLARELKALGKRVLVSTTTNIGSSEASQADRLVISNGKNKKQLSSIEPGTITCLGSAVLPDKEKLAGVDREFIDQLYGKYLFDYIIVEADGSKRKPIKAPAEYEPVIPSKTTRTIGIIGLDALDTTITEDTVHRPELFCNITGKQPGEKIDRGCFVDLILSGKGLFKDAPESCRKQVIFNKADDGSRQKEGQRIIQELMQQQSFIDHFIIASIGKGHIVCSVAGR